MPHHLFDISQDCDHPGCPKPATYELRNGVNAPIARYCSRHGEQHLALIRKAEQHQAAREGSES